MVWRWQQRFAEEGPDGLLRDKTRKPGKPPILAGTVARVVALTCGDPPAGVTHWTGRAMAKVAGISLRSVQRIWDAHQLQPHRVRSFKRSRDPRFAEKMADVVGLYLDPPAHAVVLSIDEKSQIQALDRTQPGLPLKPGRCGTMTHDYKRHGTTTLFAALNVLEGTVIGRCMQRHRHEEFIRFLNTVERAVPAGRIIEAVVDNYATHKHPKVKAWLARQTADLRPHMLPPMLDGEHVAVQLCHPLPTFHRQFEVSNCITDVRFDLVPEKPRILLGQIRWRGITQLLIDPYFRELME